MNIKNNNIKCVIFDCDGVLVDSEKLCCQALVHVFESCGVTASRDDFLAHFNGGKIADILTEAKERLAVKVSLDELEPAYRNQLELLYSKGLKPIEGVFDVLAQLDARGIDYCSISNSPGEKIEQSLMLTGLKEKFSGRYFSAFDANSWKPEPDLLLYAAMSMGYAAKECIYIDDTLKGLEAGVRANIETYHFRPGDGVINNEYPQVKELSDIRQVAELI